MSKFLVETQKPIGVVVFSIRFGDDLRIKNASLWNKVNTVEDFRELEKEIEVKYNDRLYPYADFSIINIIYF